MNLKEAKMFKALVLFLMCIVMSEVFNIVTNYSFLSIKNLFTYICFIDLPMPGKIKTVQHLAVLVKLLICSLHLQGLTSCSCFFIGLNLLKQNLFS